MFADHRCADVGPVLSLHAVWQPGVFPQVEGRVRVLTIKSIGDAPVMVWC